MLFTAFQSIAQTGNDSPRSKARLLREVPDMPYLAPSGGRETPALQINSATFTMVQVNVGPTGQNILGDAANEPSMNINPTDPQHIVIGWRQFDNVLSNFRQAGYGYSTDGGLTWTFPGVITPGTFRSDPVLDADAQGFVFYNSLTSDAGTYTCRVFKSDNGGSSWDLGVEAHGGDKQWMTIDRSGGIGDGNIYSDWNYYFSSCYPAAFTRSTNNGATYENCTDLPGTPYWGTMTVGNNGELYTTGWSDTYGLVVLKSTNAQDPLATPAWTMSMSNLDGQPVYGQLINPVGLSGQVSIAVDGSTGPARDNVYLLCSVQRLSNSDSADVMFTRSTDGGFTWNSPVRVNDDDGTGSYQWFGTMSVAPNGRIDATWLDTRDSPPGELLSALYYSYSLDQGDSWSPSQKLTPLFDSRIGWPQQEKMGDYVSMASDNDKAYLAWTNTLNGEQDVYFSTIKPITTGVTSHQKDGEGIQLSTFPNPFSGHSTIEYSLPAGDDIRISILDICGKEIKTLFAGFREKGNQRLSFSGEELPRGYYFIRIASSSQSATISAVKID